MTICVRYPLPLPLCMHFELLVESPNKVLS